MVTAPSAIAGQQQRWTPADSAELFNRVGQYWKKVFAHSHALGIQNVLGAGPKGRGRSQIGLKHIQNRIEDRQTRTA